MAYAYPVGASAETGRAKSVTAAIGSANTLVSVFTATQKTKVSSILISNTYGTILPVEIHVYRASSSANYFLSKVRVLKAKYAVLPLVSGDNRTADTPSSESDNKTDIEIVLQVGDIIKAKCPLANVVNVTAELKEGVK